MKHIAIYARVSGRSQDTASQEPDLAKWAELHSAGRPVRWYQDCESGKTMHRPGWLEIEKALLLGEVHSVVCWRLDRLGRTCAGLTRLFDELLALGVNLVSVKDSLDLSTPAGRLMANVLASVAQYETEVRAERVKAGIARAKAEGKRWGGSKPGQRRYRVTEAKISAIRSLYDQGRPVADIAQAVGLCRQTIYNILDAPERS